MLFKEDVEQSLKKVLTSLTIDGDTIRALTELYNSLPSSETVSRLKEIDIDITPDNKPVREIDFLTYKSTKQELQDLADELNEAEPIDWRDRSQAKHSINLDSVNEELGLSYTYRLKELNIYSTDKEFLKKAKERIGEERLIKLFKEGI